MLIGWIQLTPFVANRVEKESWKNPIDEVTGLPLGYGKPGSGHEYLEKWKRQNGQY
jgi:hypothetical protein